MLLLQELEDTLLGFTGDLLLLLVPAGLILFLPTEPFGGPNHAHASVCEVLIGWQASSTIAAGIRTPAELCGF